MSDNSPARHPQPPRCVASLTNGARLAARDLCRHWWVASGLIAIWTLAVLRLFVYRVPLIPLLFNITGSLPYHVLLVDPTSGSLRRGDLVVFEFTGAAGEHDYPGLRGQAFFKRVAGIAGDRISVQGRDVAINGRFVGSAKQQTFDHRPLEPIAAGVIPPGWLYMQGTSPDSFDSRYRSSGLVPETRVRARVRPLF